MEFIKQKNVLKYDDLISINELLKTGLSLKNTLELIQNKDNVKIIKSIVENLDQGKQIEEVIVTYLPKNVATYLSSLLNNLSFSDALNLSLAFIDKNKENVKTFMGAFLYPFVLLFVSLSALYIFDAYGLDTILNMLKSFTGDIKSINIFRIILRIVVYIFYFSLLIVLGLILYFFNDKNITLFYVLVCKYLPNSIVQKYFCVEFISLLNICINNGYKSKDSLNILKNLHNKPIVSFLAFHLDEKLLEGDSLKEAVKQDYYDYSLSKFINLASHSLSFLKILNDYINLNTNIIKAKMKKLALSIQFVTYALIGVVIIFIYQILFLPMNALANF